MKDLKLMVFQTDFGYKDSTVAAMYGVVKRVNRSLEIIDSTHELPQFDIWSASYRLWQAMRFWPEGTVFVSVVDPGVGTARKACAAMTEDGYYIVTPDNGTLTHVLKEHGIREVREIDETVNRLHDAGTDGTSVFHGRDLFGYCAAKLAANIITFEEVGPAYPVNEIVELPMETPDYEEGCIRGVIEIDDPNFGNLFTNIDTANALECGFRYGEHVLVTIQHEEETVFERKLLFAKTFGEVEEGSPVLYNNERMKLSLAVSCGSFVQAFQIGFGSDWKITLRREP
ncbi:MAG: SAM-dependent chlorinase/fluorinase [Solobacterium sp.]|nr:SAM-dependent chlorinase/fluorinase [Solobacterium sp.]